MITASSHTVNVPTTPTAATIVTAAGLSPLRGALPPTAVCGQMGTLAPVLYAPSSLLDCPTASSGQHWWSSVESHRTGSADEYNITGAGRCEEVWQTYLFDLLTSASHQLAGAAARPHSEPPTAMLSFNHRDGESCSGPADWAAALSASRAV